MLYHIMKIYAHYGFNDFVLALGYKQEIIKDYFEHFNQINSDLLVHTGRFRGEPYMSHYSESISDSWDIWLADTGEETMKGARLKRVEKYVGGETFMVTYGDGVGDIDIPRLLTFHKSHGKIATVTGVHPAPRFGELHCRENACLSFNEKPQDSHCWINGGFFVFNREIFDYLTTDEWCDLEIGPLEILAAKGELMVYKHEGFWACMDTLREMGYLNQLWKEGKAPWKVWK
jgi:glucose-1-phosphate cytidylyltransferase